MAKTNPTLGPNSGKIGNLVYYTRFGKEFVRRKAETFTDCKSEAQLRQRAIFKATQQSRRHSTIPCGSTKKRAATRLLFFQAHIWCGILFLGRRQPACDGGARGLPCALHPSVVPI